MNACPPAIQALVDHLEALSVRRSSCRRVAGWAATEPVLCGYPTPAHVAAAIRIARPIEQDALVGALIRLAAEDDLAQLTVVAGLSRRLGWIVTGWRRAGVPPGELGELESDLLCGCWMAVAALARSFGGGGEVPPRLAMSIVQTAWQEVRAPRRRQRRHDSRRDGSITQPRSQPAVAPAGEELATVIVSAVKARQVSVTGARLIFATRVAGWSVTETAERLGCSPQSVRTRRARAEQRLAAA